MSLPFGFRKYQGREFSGPLNNEYRKIIKYTMGHTITLNVILAAGYKAGQPKIYITTITDCKDIFHIPL